MNKKTVRLTPTQLILGAIFIILTAVIIMSIMYLKKPANPTNGQAQQENISQEIQKISQDLSILQEEVLEGENLLKDIPDDGIFSIQ